VAERCVLFPKTSDALTDLLVKKVVYTDLDETILEVEEELDPYEDLLDMERRKLSLLSSTS
jgi:hypothetical protein